MGGRCLASPRAMQPMNFRIHRSDRGFGTSLYLGHALYDPFQLIGINAKLTRHIQSLTLPQR